MIDKKYIPILRAKQGEFKALKQIKNSTSHHITPLLEIPKITTKTLESKKYQNVTQVIDCHINEIIEKIHANCQGLDIMVDISQWSPDTVTEQGEHVIFTLYSKINKSKCKLIPLINFEYWSDYSYQAAITEAIKQTKPEVIYTRIEHSAINDAQDEAFIEGVMEEIFEQTISYPAQHVAMLDFGDLTGQAIISLIEKAEKIIKILSGMGVENFSIGGASLPATIDKAVKEKDSCGLVVRKEVALWKVIQSSNPSMKFIFSDYGVRNPRCIDDVIAPDANGKIRYTTQNAHYIARGHSVREPGKFNQMHHLAREIIKSPYFMGVDFSWGDSEILIRSVDASKTGNHTTWISIDTSHHLASVLHEIFETEIQNTNKKQVPNINYS